MKVPFRHSLCLIYALLSVLCMNGQTLNRYETLCGECLKLKDKVRRGITVPRSEASALIEQFVNMNSDIKIRLEAMTNADKTRFEAINIWFSSGIRPKVLDHKPINAGPSLHSDYLAIPYDRRIASYNENYSPQPETPVLRQIKVFVLGICSFPYESYGAMIGVQAKNCGGYVRYSSNFKKSKAKYSCLSNGTICGDIADGYSFWPGGNEKQSNMKVSTGILYSPIDWLMIYGGFGHGYSYLDWNDIEGYWARVEDYSLKGIIGETGILTTWKYLQFGLGISSISFRTTSLDVLFGVRF